VSPHPNAVRIQQAYEALGRGDVGAVLEAFTVDTLFHMPGGGELAGDHKGREAVGMVVGHLMELTGGTMAFDVHGVYADDAHAVVHVRETATRAADAPTQNTIATAEVCGRTPGVTTVAMVF